MFLPSTFALHFATAQSKFEESKRGKKIGGLTSALSAYHLVLAVKDEREDALAILPQPTGHVGE